MACAAPAAGNSSRTSQAALRLGSASRAHWRLVCRSLASVSRFSSELAALDQSNAHCVAQPLLWGAALAGGSRINPQHRY